MGTFRFCNPFKDMSRPKYKKDDWVIVKSNITTYGGMMGRVINVIPPHFSSNTVTVYTVKFDNGSIDDFTGLELKTPTPEQAQRHSRELLEEGFAIADQLFRKGAKEAEHLSHNCAKEVLKKTFPATKDVDWSDFKSEADKEWESFVK